MAQTPITYTYIRNEGSAGRMGTRLMAIVAEGERGRVFLAPTPEHEAVAKKANLVWKPDIRLEGKCRVNVSNYGFDNHGDLFTQRQLVVLTTFSDLVQEVREQVIYDALSAGLPDDGKGLVADGAGATAYSDSIGVYLAFLVDQVANHSSSICSWNSANTQMRSVFARQAIPITWDYAESNPFCYSSGSFNNLYVRQVKGLEVLGKGISGFASQADANSQLLSTDKIVSTDPPYYDNISYADLSDFFYVWLRRSLKSVFPDLFATLAVPKAEELVATPYRHESKEKAEAFFIDGMTKAMHRLAEQAHPAFPITIYYAFKQSESETDSGITSTGWETFLDAVIRSGFAATGTWPMRTEKQGRVIGIDSNALSSSIVLVCRQRMSDLPNATRRDFLNTLKAELPIAIACLQRGNIAPVDLAQAVIGPGMAVYTRYSKVLDAEGKPLSVRTALALINETLDEVFAEQEGDFDADTRWALAWFEQYGFNEGEYGVAETLSKAKNTSVSGLVEAGILYSKGGKVRLLKPAELPEDWDPLTEKRLTIWEMVHHLIRLLEQGETTAAELIAKLARKADSARELAYRLYVICERKKWAQDALAYNSLVQSWPEMEILVSELDQGQEVQGRLFSEE